MDDANEASAAMDTGDAPTAAMAMEPVAAAAPEPVAAMPENIETAKAADVEALSTTVNGSSDSGARPTAAPASETPEASVAANAANHSFDDEDDEDGGLRIAAPGDAAAADGDFTSISFGDEEEDAGGPQDLFGSDDEDQAGPADVASAAGATPSGAGFALEKEALQDSGNEASR